MTDFLVENWLLIVTLLIAITGGVPGIAAVIQHLRAKPVFGAEVVGVILGNTQLNEDPEYTHIVLTLTIYNRGLQPLPPGSFDLSIRRGRKWIKFDRFLIPEGVPFKSTQQDFKSDQFAGNDLQRSKKTLQPAMPVFGYLMFLTRALSLGELRALKPLVLKLTFTDVHGAKHKQKLRLPMRDISAGIEYPHHGLKVARREPVDGD